MKYSLEEIKKLIKIIYNEHFKCSISMFIYSDDLEKMKILDSIKIGEKFSDNAIYITDVESYSNIIKQVFYRYIGVWR